MTADPTSPEPAVMAELAGDDRVDAVLTVVGVEGSAYRPPGTKLPLRASEGPKVAALVERATDAGAFVERWNLTEGEGWGLGVRSSGVVDVLIEPADGAYRRAAERYLNRESTTVCTVVGGDSSGVSVGDRLYVEDGVAVESDAYPNELVDAVLDAVDPLTPGGTETVTVETPDGDVCVFLDSVTRPPRLLVVGAAPDARPVAELGERAGFEVLTVGVDDLARPNERSQSPAVDRVVDDASAIRDAIDRDTYAVVMTHDFRTDRRIVAELRTTDAAYVGVLGPSKRFAAIAEALAESGSALTDDERARIFAPAGLDVGGGDPQTVALSIVAEVVAVANGRRGGHLDESGTTAGRSSRR